MSTPLDDPLLTQREAADLLDVHVKTVRAWVRAGTIPYLQVGGRARFTRGMLIRWAGGETGDPMTPIPQSRLKKRGRTYHLRVYRDGKETTVSLRTASLVQARREARRIQKEEDQDRLASKPTTVAEFAERWLTEYVAQARPSSVKEARQRARDYVLPVIGGIRVPQVTTGDLRALRASVEASRQDPRPGRGERVLSPATVRHILGDVRTMFRYAAECGLLSRSPWTKAIMPRLEERIPEALTDDQVAAVLAGTPERYELAVRLSLATGIRWGELHRLRWEDVKDLPFPHLVLRKTKSGKVRRVPLSREALDVLSSGRRPRSGRVLGEWKTAYPTTVVAWIGKRGEVKWHWHQLRHTFATRWVESGRSLAALGKILGHSTIRMTERYAQMSDEAVWTEMQTGAKTGAVAVASGSPDVVSSAAFGTCDPSSVGRATD